MILSLFATVCLFFIVVDLAVQMIEEYRKDGAILLTNVVYILGTSAAMYIILRGLS